MKRSLEFSVWFQSYHYLFKATDFGIDFLSQRPELIFTPLIAKVELALKSLLKEEPKQMLWLSLEEELNLDTHCTPLNKGDNIHRKCKIYTVDNKHTFAVDCTDGRFSHLDDQDKLQDQGSETCSSVSLDGAEYEKDRFAESYKNREISFEHRDSQISCQTRTHVKRNRETLGNHETKVNFSDEIQIFCYPPDPLREVDVEDLYSNSEEEKCVLDVENSTLMHLDDSWEEEESIDFETYDFGPGNWCVGDPYFTEEEVARWTSHSVHRSSFSEEISRHRNRLFVLCLVSIK
eukprot:maker-scaffold_2-snap-gene-24.36-mRNA-1 protein AED:0.06 eAED:0.92 QI:0/0/0.5/1/0/0/2/22/290